MDNKVIDKSLERQILIGMIVSNSFLHNIWQIYKPEYMGSKDAQTVIQWCREYWEKYNKAPGREVEQIFNSKLRHMQPAQEEFIEKLLQGLSTEWERGDKFNSEYVLDRAEQMFAEKSLLLMTDDIKTDIIAGDLVQAKSRFINYKPVERPKSAGICPFTNRSAIKQAFQDSPEPLFKYPGKLGYLLNEQLIRGGFINLLAPEKRGKSFWLTEFSMRAYRARCNVAFFETGDMTLGQRLLRIHSYISQRPTRGKMEQEILYPLLDCILNQDDTCNRRDRIGRKGIWEKESDQELIDYVRDLTKDGYIACSICVNHKRFKAVPWYEVKTVYKLGWKEAVQNAREWKKIAGSKHFKLSIHVNSSLNILGMENQLDQWEQKEEFVPDVIVIDYADIMDADDSREDSRTKENTRWRKLRALSQSRHALVITASQANAASYNQDSMGMSNFSEDKRKHGHVTAEYALNQTDEEYEAGIMRLGEVVLREGKKHKNRKVRILQCLDIGRPYVTSY